MSGVDEIIKEERRKNIEDIVRDAKWNAEMVKKLGEKWFEIRDGWLNEVWERDMELQKDPEVRRALIKAMEVIDRVKRMRKDHFI